MVAELCPKRQAESRSTQSFGRGGRGCQASRLWDLASVACRGRGSAESRPLSSCGPRAGVLHPSKGSPSGNLRAFVSQLYLEERDTLHGMVFELEMLSPPTKYRSGRDKDFGLQ